MLLEELKFVEESVIELDSEMDWIFGTPAPLELVYLEMLEGHVAKLRLLLLT